MISAVADTHAAIWYLFGDPRLSRAALEFIDQSVKEKKKIAVSAITLAEVVYLGEKGRVPAGKLVSGSDRFAERCGSKVSSSAIWIS